MHFLLPVVRGLRRNESRVHRQREDGQLFALWIRTTVETKRIKETPGVAPSCLLLFALCFLGLLCLYVPSPSYLLGPKSSASHTQSGDASYWGSPPPVLLGALVSEIACYTVFILRGHE